MKNSDYSVPKWIVLQLLEQCNLRCKMCYEWGETGTYKTEKRSSVLAFEKIEEIVKVSQISKPYYELFGGEQMEVMLMLQQMGLY